MAFKYVLKVNCGQDSNQIVIYGGLTTRGSPSSVGFRAPQVVKAEMEAAAKAEAEAKAKEAAEAKAKAEAEKKAKEESAGAVLW